MDKNTAKVKRFERIPYKGVEWKCRLLKTVDGDDVMIGSLSMLDTLQPYEMTDYSDGFDSKRAEDIYDEIFYFTSDKDIEDLDDEELIESLVKDNKDFEDWFIDNLKKEGTNYDNRCNNRCHK